MSTLKLRRVKEFAQSAQLLSEGVDMLIPGLSDYKPHATQVCFT